MSNVAEGRGDEKRDRQNQTTGGAKKPDPAAPGSTPPSHGPPGGPPPPYRETTYREGDTGGRFLTAKEVLAQDGTDVDFFWDRAFGRVRIRYPDGRDSGVMRRIRGVGPDIGIRLLDDVLWAEGTILAVEDLNPCLESVRKSPVVRAQRVKCLRTGFKDSAKAEWFFIVGDHPWTIAWNVSRSWRIIEPA